MIANKMKLLIPALSAAAACLTISPSANATVVGILDINSTGTVTVTSTAITFSGGDTTTAATTLTYNSGTALGTGVSGSLMNLTGTLPVNSFMTFTGTPLAFNLTAIGPGSANTTCSGLAVGGSCSVFAGSPFILTLTTTGTAIALSVAGLVHDSTTVVSTWMGDFTTQLAGETPAQIQAIFATPGGSLVAGFSGDFKAVTNVPEPNTAMLLGAALLGLGVVIRRLTRS
jgi:hypothetical protein